MSAGQLTLTIEQGTTFLRIFTIKDSAGNPVNLTGYDLRGQIRETYSSSAVIISFNFEIHEPLNGKFKMSLSPTETSSIPVEAASSFKKSLTKYAYDVELVAPSGSIERLIEGVAQISPEVTR